MTSRRLALTLAVLCATGAACGNYSNEDLEFMNALPESSDLAVNMPAVTSAVELANEAELAKSTHDTTRGLNGLLMGLVGIVDAVRSYPPTGRTATSRIWGPFPTDRTKLKNLDWETKMIVNRDATDLGRFDYEISAHHDGAADTDWPVLISGWFQVGKTARRGMGHVELVTATARAEDYDTSDLGTPRPPGDRLRHERRSRDGQPMHITDLPAAGSTDPAPTAAFTYAQNASAGQGGDDLRPSWGTSSWSLPPRSRTSGSPATWLGTGEGRGRPDGHLGRRCRGAANGVLGTVLPVDVQRQAVGAGRRRPGLAAWRSH